MSPSRREILRGAAAGLAWGTLPRVARADEPELFYQLQDYNAVLTADPGDLDLSFGPAGVLGQVPTELHGSRFWVNGPARLSEGGVTVHPFDGHGYLRRFTFTEDGGLALRARYVRTAAFQAEDAAGELRYAGLGTLVAPGEFADGHAKANRKALAPRSVANTTAVPWNGQILAGYEGGLPYAVDPESMDTAGEQDFGGVVAPPFLAHMRVDHAAQRLVGLSLELGTSTRLTFHELDTAGKPVSARTVEIPGLMAVHDFAITPRWYVLMRNRLKLHPAGLARAELGLDTLMNALSAPEGEPGELLLLPRAAGGALVRVPMPGPAFVVHYANAFERGDTVVVDACVFPTVYMGKELGFQGRDRPFDPSGEEGQVLQHLQRLEVDPATARVSVQDVGRRAIDFPRVHPTRDGLPTRMVVGAGRANITRSFPFDSVVALWPDDPGREHVWTPGGGRLVGEPVLVPRGEDDGLVVVATYTARDCRICVLDAAEIAKGPLAEVPVPVMPLGFHGAWQAPA